MSSVAVADKELRTSGNNIKLPVARIITNQRHIATGSSTYTDTLFINREICSMLALDFVKRASAIGLWRSSLHEFE